MAAERWRAVDRALGRLDRIDLDWLGPLAAPTGWSLEARSLRLVAALVAELRPGHVLEFGSGISTRVLARACAGLQPPACFSSIENDPFFIDAVRSDLEGDRRAVPVALQLAPLVLRRCAGRLCPVYHVRPELLASDLPASLVLVDGPPELLGGRAGTVFQAFELGERGTVLVLDDAGRESEGAALAFWQDALSSALEVRVLPGFESGLAVAVLGEREGGRSGGWWLNALEPPACVKGRSATAT